MILFRIVALLILLAIELFAIGAVILCICLIPVFFSWLVIRPYGQDPQIDMMLCVLLLFILLKYPYDDIK